MAVYSHFEERVAGDHVHLDAQPQHGVVLPPAQVVALEQAAPRGLARARQLRQVHVAEAQLLVRPTTWKCNNQKFKIKICKS